MTLRIPPEEIVARSASALLAVHPSWERVRLGDVAEVLNGFAFKSTFFTKDGGVPLLRIRDVGRSTTAAFYEGEYDNTYLVEPGELVIGMDGDFRVHRWSGPTALLNQRVCKVMMRSEQLYDKGFLYYVLPGYLDAVHTFTSSVTVKHLSSRTILDLPLPLPPLAEQRRIVAAIEEQFSRLDAADSSVARVGRQLPGLRASAIDAAFDRSWKMRPFESVAKVASNLVDPAIYAKVPHIAPNHIESGTGRLLPYRTIADDGVTSAKHLFRPGQILYSKIRPYLKKAVVADFDGLCSADMYPIDTELEPRFLQWWMLSERFTAEAIKQQGRSVLPKINKEGLSRLLVPVPEPDEQRTAADTVEQQLSLMDSLRAAVESAQKRSAALRRSILERAFRGELAPQDPDDEPAAVILERIRAERAAARAPTSRRRVPA